MMSSSRLSVTKSLPLLVGPWEPTPAGTLPLTAMDTALAGLPMAVLLVFDRPMGRQAPPAETIRRALSRALVPYHPVAGRLTTTGGGGGLAIACTGEGVAFVAARADCTLHDARLTDRRPAVPVEELTVTYASKIEDPRRSLVMVQVTEFSCGGFIVGVTWDHAVADGVGMARFLHAVGEFARAIFPSPSSIDRPVRTDRLLPDLPPPVVSMASALVKSAHNEFPSSYVTVPASFVDRVKAEFRRRQNQGQKAAPCSAFEVFVAAIWKCRARATSSVTSSAAAASDRLVLVFTANVRKQSDAKDGYYGNLFTFGLAVATRGEVADGNLLDLVKRVKDAKARVPYTFTDGAAYVGEETQGVAAYDTLYVTSWWNLGFDDVDFGAGAGGGPVRVMGNMERRVVPACILCGRKDRADGVAAVAMCVREEHEEPFHAELERLIA